MHSPPNPVFSIITICRNAAATIEKTLSSVADQQLDADRYEHIVIDGSSQDETLDIIRKYQRVRWISEPDEGIADAFNKGLSMARGDYLLYLNADDYLHDSAVLSDTEAFLSDNDRPSWIVGDLATMETDRPTIFSPRLPVSCLSMMFYCRVSHPSVFLKRKALNELDGFHTQYQVCMDYDLWQRMCERGYRPVHMRRVVSVFATDGISSAGSASQLHERREIQRRFRNTLPKRVIGAAYDFIKNR